MSPHTWHPVCPRRADAEELRRVAVRTAPFTLQRESRPVSPAAALPVCPFRSARAVPGSEPLVGRSQIAGIAEAIPIHGAVSTNVQLVSAEAVLNEVADAYRIALGERLFAAYALGAWRMVGSARW